MLPCTFIAGISKNGVIVAFVSDLHYLPVSVEETHVGSAHGQDIFVLWIAQSKDGDIRSRGRLAQYDGVRLIVLHDA